MATNLKRFTISVTPSMEEELDSVKKERYYRGTQNDMIRDLINRGLDSLKEDVSGLSIASQNNVEQKPEAAAG